MLARIAIVLGVIAYLPLARGQMQMGNSCPYNFQMAPNVFNPNDGKSMDQRRMDIAKVHLEQLDKQIGENGPLRKRVEADELAIRHRIDGDAADAIIDHIEGNPEADIACRFDEAPPTNYQPEPQYQQPPSTVPEQRSPGHQSPPEGPHTSNQRVDMSRMPAAADAAAQPVLPGGGASVPFLSSTPGVTDVTDNTATLGVAAAKAKDAPAAADNPPPPAAAPVAPAPAAPPATGGTPQKVTPSEAPLVAPQRRDAHDGYGNGGTNRFCVSHWRVDGQDHDFYHDWIRGDRDIDPAACNETVGSVDVPGTYNNSRIKSACVRALKDLRRDHEKLAALQVQHDKYERDFNDFQDHLNGLTEAGPGMGYGNLNNNYASGNYNNGNGMQSFMQFMSNMMRMQSNGYGGHPQVLPMPMRNGGWPMQPGTPYQPFNYNSFNPGLMGNNGGCYGCVNGGVGQGAFGCNGMGNQNLYGNPFNMGGPGGFRPPFAPWQAGAPFSLPMPHPSVLPMPGGGRPMPYLGSNFGGGMPFGSGVGYGGYGSGALPMPMYGGGAGGGYGAYGAGGYTGGYGGGVYGGGGYNGNGYAAGSIRPAVPGGVSAAYGYGGTVGTGYYGGNYSPSTVPPILQPSPVLGAGSSGGRPPSQLPIVP